MTELVREIMIDATPETIWPTATRANVAVAYACTAGSGVNSGTSTPLTSSRPTPSPRPIGPAGGYEPVSGPKEVLTCIPRRTQGSNTYPAPRTVRIHLGCS